METLQWRHTHHYVKGESVEVGDVPGHVAGVIQGAGLAFFAGGEVATHSMTILHDFRNGTGPHSGYLTYAFEDGSTLSLSYQGTSTTAAGQTTTTIEGSFSFTRGDGRFSGATGGGQYRGRRLIPLAGGGEVYLDFVGSYSR